MSSRRSHQGRSALKPDNLQISSDPLAKATTKEDPNDPETKSIPNSAAICKCYSFSLLESRLHAHAVHCRPREVSFLWDSAVKERETPVGGSGMEENGKAELMDGETSAKKRKLTN